IPDFDRELHKYLDERFAVYRGSFKVKLGAYEDLTKFEIAAAAHPKDADVQADVALSYFANEKPDKAQAAADAALAIDAKNKKALYIAAELALARGDADAAKGRIDALIAAGGDGYDVRMRLATIALAAGNLKQAEAEWQKAKPLDPQRSEPSMRLAEMYQKLHRDDQAVAELERYVYIEQMDYAPLKKLVDIYAGKKNWGKVRELGEMGVFVNPYDVDLHLTLAEAYVGLGDGA